MILKNIIPQSGREWDNNKKGQVANAPPIQLEDTSRVTLFIQRFIFFLGARKEYRFKNKIKNKKYRPLVDLATIQSR